jgi:hypothetical protein
MSCNGICMRHKACKSVNHYRYCVGQKRCQVCQIFIKWPIVWPRRCRYRLRTNPRRVKYKATLCRSMIKKSAKKSRVDEKGRTVVLYSPHLLHWGFVLTLQLARSCRQLPFMKYSRCGAPSLSWTILCWPFFGAPDWRGPMGSLLNDNIHTSPKLQVIKRSSKKSFVHLIHRLRYT